MEIFLTVYNTNKTLFSIFSTEFLCLECQRLYNIDIVSMHTCRKIVLFSIKFCDMKLNQLTRVIKLCYWKIWRPDTKPVWVLMTRWSNELGLLSQCCHIINNNITGHRQLWFLFYMMVTRKKETSFSLVVVGGVFIYYRQGSSTLTIITPALLNVFL